MLGALVGLALVGFFAGLLLMTACGLAAWMNKPEGIRPPWWDWAMDKRDGAKSKLPEVETAPREVVEELSALESPKPSKPTPRW